MLLKKFFIVGAVAILYIGMPGAYADEIYPNISGELSPDEDDCSSIIACTPGVSLDLTYTGEIWRNTKGGLRRDTRYLDNLDIQLEVDMEEVFGLSGGTFFAYGLLNNGEEFSADVVGDAQVVSNIDAPYALRVLELWYQQNFLDDRLSFLLGLWDLNSEFDANDTGSLFINSSHGIGAEIAQTGENGPSIFPVTSLAFRAAWKATDTLTLKAAVLDAVPGDPDNFSKTTIDLSDDEGALTVVEASYENEGTKIAGGYWVYSGDFDHLTKTGGMGMPLREDGNDGFYVLAEQKVFSEADDPDQGLSVFARYGVADDDFNQFKSYAGLGAVYTGLFPGRDEDQIGFAMALAENGSPYKRALAMSSSFADSREVNLELTYRAQITPWLALQPDIQYIINPGTDPALDDALVVGLRAEISLGLF